MTAYSLSDRRTTHAQTTWAATDIVFVTTAADASKVMTLDDLFTEIVTGVVIKTANGVDVTPGSDIDTDLITCNVTGTPKLWWDESEDAFTSSKPLAVESIKCSGAGTDNWVVNATDNAIDATAVTSLISGGGRTGYPNLIGSVAKPAGTPPVGMSVVWDTDSGYVAGAADVATIGGGYDHVCNQEAGTIVGGGHNFIMYNADGHSTIVGNSFNLINCGRAIIAGAYNSSITGTSQYSGIYGGTTHAIVGTYSSIVGGTSHTVTGAYSAIVGGGTGAITGNWSGILGGLNCAVTGSCSYAFGRRAKVTDNGCVQFADYTDADVTNATVNSFAGRFAGGYYFNGGTVGSKTTGGVAVANLDEGATGCLTRKCVRELVTLSGATTVTTLNIPAGALLLGAQFCVNTAVSDDTADPDTWSAAFSGGSSTALATSAAAAKQTKVNTLIVPEVAASTTNITFTPQGGSFDGGVIEVLVYYEVLTAMANAA